MCSPDRLLARIEVLRKKMAKVTLNKGFTHKESIALSQELDELLNHYQRMGKNSE